jgi:hypothetical protein
VENPEIGDLVSVAGSGAGALDAIVFDTPSRSKVVVAVVDPGRGPVFRTVHPDAMSAREEAGPQDPALRSLIRRTPSPTHGAVRGSATGRKGSTGFSRPSAHRTTGR